MFDLKGKIAVVTGASQGLGLRYGTWACKGRSDNCGRRY